MPWKQIIFNLLIMGVVYALAYSSSFFFSKRYAIKRNKEKEEKKLK